MITRHDPYKATNERTCACDHHKCGRHIPIPVQRMLNHKQLAIKLRMMDAFVTQDTSIARCHHVHEHMTCTTKHGMANHAFQRRIRMIYEGKMALFEHTIYEAIRTRQHAADIDDEVKCQNRTSANGLLLLLFADTVGIGSSCCHACCRWILSIGSPIS
jgi:hypothetical protein